MPLEKRRRILHRNGILRPARALRLYETADYSAVLASIHQKPQRMSVGDAAQVISAWWGKKHPIIDAALHQLMANLLSPRFLIGAACTGLLLWLTCQPNPIGAARAFWASEWGYAFKDAALVLRGTATVIKAKPVPLLVPVATSKAAARDGSFKRGRLEPDGSYKIIEDLGDVLQIESSGGTGWVMGRYVDRKFSIPISGE